MGSSPPWANIVQEVRRSGVRPSVKRIARSIRRHGLRAAIHRVGGVGVPYWWHRLDLSEIVVAALPSDIELRRGTDGDLDLYGQLADPHVLRQSKDWIKAGNDLWLALSEGSRTAFSCWIFRERMPMGESLDGWLRMPPGVAFLEHSVTSSNFRGRGIAPGAWSAIAGKLRDEGLSTLFTKVTEDNVVTHNSLAKVGFSRAAEDDPVVLDFGRQLGRR
jgi:GNAT superfamily N-acetyltransferase